MQSKIQVTLYGALGSSPALQVPGLEGPVVAIQEATLRQLVSDLYTARSMLNPNSWMTPGGNWTAWWSAGWTSTRRCCWTWKCMAADSPLNRARSCG